MKKIISIFISIILIAAVSVSALPLSVCAEESSNHLLLFYDDFEDTYTHMNIVSNSKVSIARETFGESKQICFQTIEGIEGGGYADAVLSDDVDDKVIVDALITPIQIEGNAFVKLFDSKATSGTSASWRDGIALNSDGTVTMKNEGGASEYICRWEAGVKFRFTALYDIPEGKCSIYIDESFIKEISVKSIYAKTYRIDIDNSKGGSAKAYVDNLKIYASDKILSDSAFDTDVRYSVMDFDNIAKKSLGNAWLFTDAVYYYKNGEKIKYTSESQKPIIYDEKMYITENFASDILNINPDTLEKSYIDNRYLIDAEKAAEALGKEYLYDERGFFILSDEEFPYTNSKDFTKLFEKSDKIYRYVNFDNTKSEEVINALKNNRENKSHPRLCYTDEDIEYIKNKFETDKKWSAILSSVIAKGNSYLGADIKVTPDCANSKKQDQSGIFQNAIEALSQAYLLTGDTRYADKGISYMKAASEWESLAVENSNLTTGHWAMGMAVGYDAFYNYLMQSSEGQENAALFREAVKRLPFADAIKAYKGGGGVHWINICDNFQGVISGGMMALLLSVADEEDVREEVLYLLENVLRSMQLAVSLYAPDGGYFEGVAYSEYMLTNLSNAITSLFNCCGTDWGLGNAKGFRNAGEFFVYMQTPEHRFNFSDCSRPATNTMLPAFFAHYYGSVSAAKMTILENEYRDTSYDMSGYLHYDKAISIWGDADVSHYGTDKYFKAAESGVFRNTFGTGEPTFVGFHGGTTGRAHDMLDSGEFVFEAGGLPWAIDLGADSYSLPSYFGTDGYKIYRKHTQGENCVLINPLTDTENYFGQAIGEEAPLISYVSKPKGAFAAFDMTNVYKRDVTSYKRGYYFGDNRNTLTVQDEITLKDTSELYWFMHTASDIEIVDGDTARLTYGGEELLLEVYSNKPFTLSKMAPEPLEGTPVIEGQAENEGISKVSIHFENASGDVNIAVKLIYQSEYYTADTLSFVPIDNWQIDEGEREADAVLTDVYADPLGKLSGMVQLPLETKEAYLYIDGKEFQKLDIPLGSPKRFSDIDVSQIGNGRHSAKLRVIYENGEEFTESSFFDMVAFEGRVFYQNSLSENATVSVLPDGWSFGFSGSKTQGSDYVTLKKGTSSYAALELRASDKIYAVSDETIIAESDIMFSSADVSFNIECRNGDGKWFFNEYMLFQNGFMYDGSKFQSNKWYNIRLVINTNTNLCSFYVDGEAVIDEKLIGNATGSYVFKLQFEPLSEDDSVSYKNFKVSTMNEIRENVSVIILEDGEKAYARMSITDISQCESESIKAILCSYSNRGLSYVKIYDIPKADFNEAEKEFVTDSETVYLRCFLASGENIFKAEGEPLYYSLK